MSILNYDALKKRITSRTGGIIYVFVLFICGGIYFTGTLIAPTLIDAFYTRLFGVIFFLMATIIHVKVLLEERKTRKYS
ncbi:MAG: hypothetical protein Sapg2KO_32390 [Saprospiraceae bacterium]